MRKQPENRRGIFLGLALIAMTVLAYLPAIQNGGFIWDDQDYILHNKTLRDAAGLRQIWTNPRATPQYYPLVHTTYWIEYRLWGLDPTGYHVINILLHALGAVLLWLVLRQLKVPGAWLAAALFAVHPVHVESVAWITERKNVLSGVFYLGAALAYLKWDDAQAGGERRHAGYLTSLILFLCALLSKTVAATLPAALVLVTWWKGGFQSQRVPGTERTGKRGGWDHILPLVPFFMLGLVLSGVTVWLEKHHVGASGAEWHLSFIDRCLVAGRVAWFYVGKLLWPAGLCFNYPRWDIDAGVWWQYLYPLSFAAVVVLLWTVRKRIGLGPLVAVLFFAGTLLPALGFFDVYPMRYSFVADHFQYLASIGLLALVGAVIARACRLEPLAGAVDRMWLRGGVLPAGGVIVILAFLTANQCGIYRNLETLWLDTIAKNPASWMAYNNMGQLYIKKDRPSAAIPVLKKCLELNPKEITARNNLGVALSLLGRRDEAIQQYEKALEIDPGDPQAYNNIGAAMAAQGRFEEAITFYKRAVAVRPGLAATHSNLGAALAKLGRIDEAIRHHEKALAIAPDLGAAQMKYGETLQAVGRIREAADRYRIALSLDQSLAEAHNNLGIIAAGDQLLPAALEHFRQALKQAPDYAEAHSNLAGILLAIGRPAEAEQHFRQAIQLAPQSGTVRIRYADFLLQRGDKAAARREYLASVKLMPDNTDLLFKLGVIDQQAGDKAAAETRFRAVLDRVPTHGQACNHLAVLLAGQGKNEEAVNLLREAVKLVPGNAELYNNLGVILVRMGNQRDALAALKEAVRLNPDYAEASKNLKDLQDLMRNRSK